ncbi:reverse transcriptase domain-containing protein [Brevibacillus sp. AY1]|uniref:reverse transcriptase domain-containing protein n=1 Tax=Brevibacillus sp. AY1 TaxID=2807621 RepID=UPI0024540F31|nr:reverse transcriptase domain-containing protein [Brevibacillus sp. AY1]
MRDKLNNYRMFKLRKKNGSERNIYSASTNLAILQQKLAYILSLNFNDHERSHGFVKNRSIVTNASVHLNKKYVLNFDLENFFESIKFPRVRHMFMAYFKFNAKVAATLANICCHPDGFLPQGAATSPIISNILAKSLDKDLTRIAINTKWCHYTRYADDITFSTNNKKFPKEIAYLKEDGSVALNDNIVNVVEKNGFQINFEKTRLDSYKENKTVTGITVNEKLNVSRRYIRRIRSILNCIEKNIENLDNAKKIFESKYPFRQREKAKQPDMFRILRGMISHVGHVKGRQDPVYLKLARRFNEIAKLYSLPSIKLPLSSREFHESHTFVIDCDTQYYITKDDELSEAFSGQGTGFLLKNIGLVTNSHVIEDFIDIIAEKGTFTKKFYIKFYKSVNYLENQWARIICFDKDKDIAILSAEGIDTSSLGYLYNESIDKGQPIELVGFPNYRQGQEIRIQKGFVQGIRIHKSRDENNNYKRYEVSTTIYAGNSGGPIVNENNEVVGIAVKGATMDGVSPNEIIPISDVIELARKHGIGQDQENLSLQD